ncbi:hypothetical protein H2203_008997 [Taxawa tesnikishii (nom. ined.)]|nr:hypothetical protein H2203_008997 [Dothideales sp. JES 119]
MAGNIDYARLREQTMGSGLDEEAVTVNTRALIDKVLARYSGEWTTLRELIQNAADASATKVTIRFDTIPSSTVPAPQTDDPSAQLKHALLHHTLSRLVVSNNGEAFGENDWSRLKRIAEGNPDETKIGAFGVGFYSVFADCESPFVTSGDQTMAFYWKGNSLFTRRGRLPKEHAGSDTTFLLDYRNNTSPVPGLLSLCQFLSTSLTFVGLECIDLWLDQWNLLQLTKKMAPAASVNIPAEVNPKTKEGLMKIVAVEYQNAQIDAKWMNVVGWTRTSTSPHAGTQQSESAPYAIVAKFLQQEEEAVQRAISEDLAGSSQATVFLRISTVNVQTYIAKGLAAELERATKKPPPKHTRIAILTSSYDETSASLSTLSGSGSGKAADIFASVLPSKNGRIFIGFPTAQTTGLLAHISAPSVIPTVERENIDLNARYVRTWNVEMLRVAGIACRVAYTGEMAELKARLSRQLASSGNKKVQKADLAAIMPASIHAFKQYTYQESTPSSQVGQIIEEAFWTCNQKASIDVLSTRGVLPSFEVRLATEDLSFVDGIPVVPDEIVEKTPAFLHKLREYGLLSEITTHDIKKELEARALEEAQLTELIKWAARKLQTEELDASAVHSLFDGTVATISGEHAGTYAGPVLLLGGIDSFPNVTKVPADLPMPPSTIPFRFIKGIPKNQLEAFGWDELQIVPWLRYLIEKDGAGLLPDQSITKSSAFAAQVLPVLSKSWESLSQSSKATSVDLLSNRTVIPTKLGMRKPPQAYFASVKLFDDLPTVTGLQGVKEKFLAALGVRKTVELSVVFERLMTKSTSEKGATESKWSHVDLIKYLVTVRDDIPADDINKLRKTPICPMEQQGTDANGSGRLYRVSELFEPKPVLRELNLPILHWPDAWRPTSPEAKFLGSLGLKPYPSVPELVDIMSKSAARGDVKLYETALQYFLANHYPNGYRRFNMATIDVPFLPLQGYGLEKLAIPQHCFANKRSVLLGFNVLREDLQPHASNLGVELDPPINVSAERLLKNPPKTRAEAKDVFGYFAGRLNEIGPSGNVAERLGTALIVPLTKAGAEKTRFVAPRSCFLGDSQTYGDIFDFVDFGSEANSFLLKVGSKHEPSAVELAAMLVREPARLLNTLGAEKYLSLLRRIADNAAALKNDKGLWANLKRAHCLLAYREVSTMPDGSNEEDDADRLDEEEASIKEYLLAASGGMVLVDDFASYRLFRNSLLSAPQEEILETFYAALGTPWLGSLVEDDQRMGPLLKDQSPADKLQKLIFERCRLFLHDHTTDAIRHDARWLEKTLKVQVTSSLSSRRTLRGYNVTYTEKKTAAMHRETKKDATLYVTARPDLYEVSRALMSLLLKRPKQQDFLALEMIMESDLRRLKTKGYNVDRILRQKAAESRIAENERQKQLEEEQKRVAEQERAWKASQAQTNGMAQDDKTPDRPKPIPGAFNDSPDQAGPSTAIGLPTRPKKNTFFGNLAKNLGFEINDQAAQQMQNLLHDTPSQPAITQASDHPPPYAVDDPHKEKVTKQPEQVTAPHDVQQNLISAVQASRAHDSSTLFSAPSTKAVKETPSYCDSKPGQDLVFVADSKPGVKIFLPKSVPAAARTTFLSNNSAALNAFAFLLLDCANIFLLKPQSVHVFYNEEGNSIAFNNNGSIFCNLRYFLQLHWNKWNRADGEGKVEAAVYWWVTLCHELAHNLVSDHGSQHEYYTESFVTMYFGKMVAKAAQYQVEGAKVA